MKFGTGIGIVIALVGIAMGATMEGSNVMVVLNPSAMLIVLGGTLGATHRRHAASSAHQGHPEALHEGVHARPTSTSTAASTSSSATPRRRAATACWPSTRRVKTIEDPFTTKGLQLVVDGTDPDLVADVLEAENEAMRKRHAAGRAAVRARPAATPRRWASSAPSSASSTCSSNLDQPETLGPSISAAFIATLLGVGVGQRRLPPDRPTA